MKKDRVYRVYRVLYDQSVTNEVKRAVFFYSRRAEGVPTDDPARIPPRTRRPCLLSPPRRRRRRRRRGTGCSCPGSRVPSNRRHKNRTQQHVKIII